MFENMKYSFSYEKVQFSKVRLDRLVLGNFTASFNQGVVLKVPIILAQEEQVINGQKELRVFILIYQDHHNMF